MSSLNSSSILTKLAGSRLFNRLRNLRGISQPLVDTPHTVVAGVAKEWSTETSPDVAVDKLSLTPGPWAFFASGYMLGLLVMTIVLHRMRNVIIPSRIPTRRVRHVFPPSRAFVTRYIYISQLLLSSILPLDFSLITTRLALHLSSIYFLCKMLLVWCLLVLQTCCLLPLFSDTQKSALWGILGHVEKLVVWVSQKEMADICWATFCTVCAALLVEGLMRTLDGIGNTLPTGNININTSPFNLVGYAFLLHAYSYPIAHSHKQTDDSPSRPDMHAIITIAIPLLQLTIFHILSVSKRYSRHRLIPTALTSLLSLAHFHGTLFLHFFTSSSTPAPIPTNPISRLKSTSYLGGPRLTYPLLNYVPNIFETVLIGTILLTVSLNALVQLLVSGKVIDLFSGLGVRSGGNWQDDDEITTSGFFSQLPYEEDFGILLLRLGTASLEATGLRGWNNEVAPIPLPLKSRNRNPNHPTGNLLRGEIFSPQTYGVVKMGRIGVTEVRHGSSFTSTSRVASSSNPYEALSIRWRRRTKSSGTQKRHQRGLFNEVRTIELGVNSTSESWRWIKQTWSFFIALWDVLKGLLFFLWDKARSRGSSQQGDKAKNISTTVQSAEEHRQDGDYQNLEDNDEGADDVQRIDREKEIYSRFLRGEEISDDEHDDDFSSSFEDEDSSPRGVEDDDDAEDKEGEKGEENGQSEAIQLFSDFLRNGHGAQMASMEGGGEMVLAHLLHDQSTSSGPLTRQGWRKLVEKGTVGSPNDYKSHFRDEDDSDSDDIWNQPINRSEAISVDSQPLFNTAACVICTSGQRDVICWPCRCLTMCSSCRELLASRSTPTKHCCPCCRRTVDGYSRIYIP